MQAFGRTLEGGGLSDWRLSGRDRRARESGRARQAGAHDEGDAAFAQADHERRPARLFEGAGRALPRVRAAARTFARAAQQGVVPADRAADARRLHAYQDIRLQLEGESGRINGRFAELDWTPILYIHRQYERPVLAALFRTAHVGYVTPLRDGMNLVAKEYVSAQDPGRSGRAGAVALRGRGAGTGRRADRQSGGYRRHGRGAGHGACRCRSPSVRRVIAT